MNQRLREYIDGLFYEAPSTVKTVEVKEEMLQNLTDKYNDLIAGGKSEDAAYNIAVASIGDVSALVRELQGAPERQAEVRVIQNKNKTRRAAFVSAAVALYILSPIPVIIFQNELGVVLLFVFVAVATALLVFNAMLNSRAREAEETMMEDFQQWRKETSGQKQVRRAVNSTLWAIGLVIYFLVSFGTGAWYITWVIFILIGAVEEIIKAFFDLKK